MSNLQKSIYLSTVEPIKNVEVAFTVTEKYSKVTKSRQIISYEAKYSFNFLCVSVCSYEHTYTHNYMKNTEVYKMSHKPSPMMSLIAFTSVIKT